MYTHALARKHTHAHSCTHTHTHSHTHVYTHTHAHTYTYTHACTLPRVCTSVSVYARTHACMHKHVHSHERISTHTRARTHTHTHTLTLTHTHARTHMHSHIPAHAALVRRIVPPHAGWRNRRHGQRKVREPSLALSSFRHAGKQSCAVRRETAVFRRKKRRLFPLCCGVRGGASPPSFPLLPPCVQRESASFRASSHLSSTLSHFSFLSLN
jgi:hypothetical protein